MNWTSERRRASARLLLNCAVGAIVLAAQPALAQNAAPTQVDETASTDEAANSEEIVVTGSSIRGVPPTGSQLISVGAEEVVNTGASTTQELLANVPQLGTFNQAPRPDPHSNGILSTAPNIRGIGQAQTLVLVNGHRLVGTGHLQNIPDPSIVPPSMIQRVEIVADGASSVYGSDGIAGVVNVITRRDYDGAAGSFRVGYGKDYNLLNTNAVIGSKWDTGGIVASVEYSRNSRLEGFDRDYITNNFSAVGGQDNRALNNCEFAVYKVNNASGAPTGNFLQLDGTANARCDNSQFTDLYPRQDRLSFMASGHQQVGPNIDLFFDAFHSKTNSDANLAPAGASGTMTRGVSPFFPTQLPASVTSITAYYSVSRLDGVRLRDVQSLGVYGGTFGADVSLGKFKWTTYWTGSQSQTDLHEGSFSPVVNSALINGTSTATAIDPFGGRTSDATKVGLADYEQYFGSRQWLWELNTKIDGPLFALPGGEAKIAVGGVYRKEFYDGKNTLSRIGFEENLGRQIGRRTVYSGFGELYVPIFGDTNGTGGLHRLDLSLSGRYDHYSDFGETFNPKIGVNWEPIKGFTLRGSWGKSFHAPALPDLFGPDTRAGYGTGGQNPPGVCGVGSTPGNCIPRTGNIFIAGGNPNLDAEKARTWSVGLDMAPEWAPGFRASVTYYNVNFKGRIAFPTAFGNFFYILPEVSQYFVDNITCPGGVAYPIPNANNLQCTSNAIDPAKVYDLIKGLRLQNFPGPVNSAADIPPVYIVTILRRVNLSEITTGGLDFDVSYRWNWAGTNMGLQIQGNRVLKYDQIAVPGAPSIDQFDFGQAKFRARTQLSVNSGPFSSAFMINYNDKYRAQYVAVSSTGATSNAVETVKAFTTFDMHLGYKLPEIGVLKDTEFSIDVDNTFDVDPPAIRSGNGYGVGSVLGRVITLGIRKKF